MNCLRTVALATAPAALLIGLAGQASAVSTPHTPKAACAAQTAGKVIAGKTAPKAKQCSIAKKAPTAKSWHWMGNYGSVYDVASGANSRGVGAGELITLPNASGTGLFPTFMYY